jgi:hypothetical protein
LDGEDAAASPVRKDRLAIASDWKVANAACVVQYEHALRTVAGVLAVPQRLPEN